MYTKNDSVIEFEVTQEDIDSGGTGTATSCPVAIAIRREVGQFVMVGWLDASIYWGDTKQVTTMFKKQVPIIYNHNYGSRIERFDKGNGMKPFKGRLTRDG